MQIVVLFVSVVVSATDLMAPTARTRYPYWQMVEEVVTQIEKQNPRPLSINLELRTPGQEYPFEAFRHLKPADLLRAAREGVEVARQSASLGKSAEEVNQKVLRNVVFALEYLPLVLEDPTTNPKKELGWMDRVSTKTNPVTDLDLLFQIIKNRDEDPILRKYLIENSVSGYSAPTLLSLTLSSYFQLRDEEFREILSGVASHPMEKPALQLTAIEVLLRYLLNSYESVFNNDPYIQSLIEQGQSPNYREVTEELLLKLSSETKNELNKVGRRMGIFAERIAGHIAEGSVRDPRIKEKTREIILFFRDHILGIDQQELALYLQGKAPEPKLNFPAPTPHPELLPDLPMLDGINVIPLDPNDGPPSFEQFGL